MKWTYKQHDWILINQTLKNNKQSQFLIKNER